MIRLRYPVGLGLAAAMLVLLALVLTTGAAQALAAANEVFFGSSADQPTEEEFMAYSMGASLQYSLVQLVPWVVLAAALTGIGALMLVVLRSRQAASGVPRG